MSITLTAHKDASIDYDGTEIKEFNSSFESPLHPGGISPGLNSYCYLLYQNFFGKWKIREQVLSEICFTNTWSYRFRNGWRYNQEELGKNIFLYGDLDKAKEECIKRNKLQNVKVKRYNG